MPSSATRTFTDPEMYFSGIRNLQIDGVITKRGEFRAELTHIDLHRLFMYRSDETASDNESSAQWDAGRDRFRDRPWRAVDADQRRRNSGRPNFQKRARLGMVPSIFGALSMGSVSLMPEDLAAASKAIIGRELVPASFARSLTPPTAAHRDCGSCTKRRTISRKPPRTSSLSPRSRERWKRRWWKRWFSA